MKFFLTTSAAVLGLFTHPGHAFVPQNMGFAPMALQKGRAFTPRAHCAILDKDNFEWDEKVDIELNVAGVVPARIGVDKSSIVKDLISIPPDMAERGDMVRSYGFGPGTKIAMHKHPQTTLQVVMQGVIRVTNEGKSKLYKAGDIYMVPANEPYELEVPGPDEGGYEPYFGLCVYLICKGNNL